MPLSRGLRHNVINTLQITIITYDIMKDGQYK